MVDTVSHVKRESKEKTSLVKWIEKAMKAQGWDVPELARQAKIDKTAVWRIISKGAGRADLHNINEMMRVLKLLPPEGDEGHIPPKDNVVFIPRKYPEFYELLEEVIQSDRADEAISACDTYLRGIMMKESRVIQKLDEIAELLRQLLEPETGPGKRRKGPALGNR